ncbi:hypothetical protein [Enterococcus dispar]
MKVKATVWLKDGNNATMMLSNTTLKAEAERYSEAMKYQVISHDGPTSIQLIPVEHIAMINLEEVVG